MSSSSCIAPEPAAALSTIATGLTRGGVSGLEPGFALVQAAAVPPPDPPFTTVQPAGMPEEKLSTRPGPADGRPTIVWKVVLQLP